MKPPWLGILLALSVVFNVFFIVGYYRASTQPQTRPSFEQRARQMAQQLGLDAGQQKSFDELLAQTIEQRSQLKAETKPLRDRLFEELVKDHPDQAVIDEFLEDDRFKQRRRFMITQMQKLMTILTPQQRQKFVELMRERWASRSKKANEEP